MLPWLSGIFTLNVKSLLWPDSDVFIVIGMYVDSDGLDYISHYTKVVSGTNVCLFGEFKATISALWNQGSYGFHFCMFVLLSVLELRKQAAQQQSSSRVWTQKKMQKIL